MNPETANFLANLAIIVLVPMLISLIVCLVWKSKMKTAKIAKTADQYIPEGGFNLTAREDTFLYRTTSRVRVASNPPPGRR